MTDKNTNYKKILKALSDDVRFEIIVILSNGEKCVCEIFESLKRKQSIVSHHLKVLKDNNLIINNKNGKWVYYSLNRKKIAELEKFTKEIIQTKKKASKC